MELKTRAHVLALDLDNVLAGEADDDSVRRARIFGVHSELREKIRSVNAQRAIVTHRSRQAAVRILHALGIDQGMVAGTFAAEDLLRAAVFNRNLKQLFRDGLRKSFILPQMCRRYKVPPCRIAMVDDRIENIHDMLQAGVGLGLVAPWRKIAKNTFLSFEFEAMVAAVNEWINGSSDDREGPSLKFLEPSAHAIVVSRYDAVLDSGFSSRIFSLCRSAVKGGRGILKSTVRRFQ